MGKRDLSLRCYNIGKYRYRELKYFCMQYADWMRSADAESKANRETLEQAARETDPALAAYIVRNVTSGIPYEHLGIVPCGRRQFYQARRKFFYLLSLKKK